MRRLNQPLNVVGHTVSIYQIEIVFEHDLDPAMTDIEQPVLDLFLAVRTTILNQATPTKTFPLRVVDLRFVSVKHESGPIEGPTGVDR